MTLAVIDTNFLMSAVLSPAGNEAEVIDVFRRHLVSVALSTAIMNEYQSVLHRDKFGLNRQRLDEFLLPFRSFAMLVRPDARLAVSPDPFDNYFLECADAAKANFLITGNPRHFPEYYSGTRIVNARMFLDIFDRSG